MPDAGAALKMAHQAKIRLFVVTNQGGIGLGLYDEAAMRRFHEAMCQAINAAGGAITDIAFCPHHPDAPAPEMRSCTCRKPQAGMLLDLASRHDIDLKKSVLIGDRDTDIEAAKNAGCLGILYAGGSLIPIMRRAIKHVLKDAGGQIDNG